MVRALPRRNIFNGRAVARFGGNQHVTCLIKLSLRDTSHKSDLHINTSLGFHHMASPCSCLDHMFPNLRCVTQHGFPVGVNYDYSAIQINLATHLKSLGRFSKRTPRHPLREVPRPIITAQFQFYFTAFFRLLFNFLSRYYSLSVLGSIQSWRLVTPYFVIPYQGELLWYSMVPSVYIFAYMTITFYGNGFPPIFC